VTPKLLILLLIAGSLCLGLGAYLTFRTPPFEVVILREQSDAKFHRYEVFVPADNEFHNTNIAVFPNSRLGMKFTRGTEGNVIFRVGLHEGSVSDSLNTTGGPEMVHTHYYRDSSYFQNHQEDPWTHELQATVVFMLVKSTRNNVSIFVEVEKL
jgi:hypothetical protein